MAKSRTTTRKLSSRSRRPRKTTEQRRAEVAALKARLAEFEQDLDAGQLAAIFALHDGYSARNAMLIAMQMPGATDVAGYVAWQKRGRQVARRAKGHGIQIVAPSGSSTTTDEKTGDKTERMFFGLTHVFDISQTDPADGAEPDGQSGNAADAGQLAESLLGGLDLDAPDDLDL